MGQGFWMSLSAWGHIMPALEKSHKSNKKKPFFHQIFALQQKLLPQLPLSMKKSKKWEFGPKNDAPLEAEIPTFSDQSQRNSKKA